MIREIASTETGTTYGSQFIRIVMEKFEEAAGISYQIEIEEPYEFNELFLGVLQENSILKHVVRNQWETFKYNQEYISYLLGMQDKDKFLSTAKQFAKNFVSMDPELLSFASHIVLTTIDEVVSSADLSHLLNVDPAEIDNTLKLIEYVKSDEEDN